MGFREGKSPREQVTETNEGHEGQLTKKGTLKGSILEENLDEIDLCSSFCSLFPHCGTPSVGISGAWARQEG